MSEGKIMSILPEMSSISYRSLGLFSRGFGFRCSALALALAFALGCGSVSGSLVVGEQTLHLARKKVS